MKRLTAPLCAIALLAVAAAPASADTITVSNTNSSGPGSLRQVLDDSSDGDLIVLRPGTYQVSSTNLLVQTSVTIRGAGARRTIIRSNGDSRLLTVDSPGTVTIRGLTITGGDAGTALGEDGGGIFAQTDLVLESVAITGNRASPDDPNNDGGGVYSTGGSLLVRNSVISGNTAYNGGGISAGGNLTLINDTITGNTSGEPDSNGWGGGVDSSGNLLIQSTTIARNRDFGGSSIDPPDSAGGLYYSGPGLSAFNSIIAQNRSFQVNGEPPGSPSNPGIPNNCSDSTIAVAAESHNLESGSDCLFDGPGSRQGADPRLGAPADNGGQTDTMRLLPGSPAINRGTDCVPTDQRGLKRALGGQCDIGAYELVRCAGVAVNRIGTAGKDTLRGSAKADGILALGGNDLLLGLGGNDGLCGGKGRDRLRGGPGRDKLLGGPGPDRLLGGPGRDRLRGGPGPDSQRQ